MFAPFAGQKSLKETKLVKIAQTEEKFWDGKTNKYIRWYFYVTKGLDVVNNFKYVGAAIFALYFALKLEGVGWLIGMGVASVLLLWLLGWLWIWKMAKVLDWLNIQLGTHWSRYGYELQERQIEALNKILNSMENGHKVAKGPRVRKDVVGKL